MPSDRTRPLPLSGLVVLDFGQIFQGPYATLLMAKAGADVIKIEPPPGEPLRRRAAPMYCWKISRRGRWMTWASAGAYCMN